MTSARRATAILALVVFVLSCRSAGGGAPFTPVTARTPDEVWRELQSRAQSFEGARSYVRLRLTDAGRTRNFNARFFASSDGRVLLEALTPVGTTAFTLYLDGNAAMWIDEIHSTWWEGTVAEVGPLARFIGSGMDSRSFAMIVLALPLGDAVREGEGGYRVGDVVYEVGAAGLASVSAGASRVEYAPVTFPPARLKFSTNAAPDTSLQLEHIELAAGRQNFSRPEVPRGYVRATPAL